MERLRRTAKPIGERVNTRNGDDSTESREITVFDANGKPIRKRFKPCVFVGATFRIHGDKDNRFVFRKECMQNRVTQTIVSQDTRTYSERQHTGAIPSEVYCVGTSAAIYRLSKSDCVLGITWTDGAPTIRPVIGAKFSPRVHN